MSQHPAFVYREEAFELHHRFAEAFRVSMDANKLAHTRSLTCICNASAISFCDYYAVFMELMLRFRQMTSA